MVILFRWVSESEEELERVREKHGRFSGEHDIFQRLLHEEYERSMQLVLKERK
jgi:predicted ABC-type ATPase